MGISGRPGTVPAEQVDSIKAIVASDRPYFPWTYLKQGRQVRIMEGPLAGTVALILNAERRSGDECGSGVISALGGSGIGRRSGRELVLNA